MNIYIYGNSSFKKEIHETLEHANIKFKLDEDSIIKNINKLDELKSTIEENPNDIYLIDDEKIIKKSGLSKKIKFLTPKDGIEEEFLLDNGIADISVDSLKEIPKYILQKHEQQQKEVSPEIQESIADIVDDAYNKEEKKLEKNDNDLELDDELAQLLSKDISSDDLAGDSIDFDEDFDFMNDNEITSNMDMSFNNSFDESLEAVDNIELPDVNLDDLDGLMNFDEPKKDEAIDPINSFDEDVGLNNISFDYDDKNILEEETNLEKASEVSENEDIIEETLTLDDFMEELSQKGEEMSNEFSELDSLNEADILSALDGLDNVTPSDVPAKSKSKPVANVSSNDISIDSSNANDLSGLLSQLLNNKTLEITIKIKD